MEWMKRKLKERKEEWNNERKKGEKLKEWKEN